MDRGPSNLALFIELQSPSHYSHWAEFLPTADRPEDFKRAKRTLHATHRQSEGSATGSFVEHLNEVEQESLKELTKEKEDFDAQLRSQEEQNKALLRGNAQLAKETLTARQQNVQLRKEVTRLAHRVSVRQSISKSLQQQMHQGQRFLQDPEEATLEDERDAMSFLEVSAELRGAHPKVDAMLDEDPVAPREVNEADVTEVLEAEDPDDLRQLHRVESSSKRYLKQMSLGTLKNGWKFQKSMKAGQERHAALLQQQSVLQKELSTSQQRGAQLRGKLEKLRTTLKKLQRSLQRGARFLGRLQAVAETPMDEVPERLKEVAEQGLMDLKPCRLQLLDGRRRLQPHHALKSIWTSGSDLELQVVVVPGPSLDLERDLTLSNPEVLEVRHWQRTVAVRIRPARLLESLAEEICGVEWCVMVRPPRRGDRRGDRSRDWSNAQVGSMLHEGLVEQFFLLLTLWLPGFVWALRFQLYFSKQQWSSFCWPTLRCALLWLSGLWWIWTPNALILASLVSPIYFSYKLLLLLTHFLRPFAEPPSFPVTPDTVGTDFATFRQRVFLLLFWLLGHVTGQKVLPYLSLLSSLGSLLIASLPYRRRMRAEAWSYFQDFLMANEVLYGDKVLLQQVHGGASEWSLCFS
eukprot:g23208.t1